MDRPGDDGGSLRVAISSESLLPPPAHGREAQVRDPRPASESARPRSNRCACDLPNGPRDGDAWHRKQRRGAPAAGTLTHQTPRTHTHTRTHTRPKPRTLYLHTYM